MKGQNNQEQPATTEEAELKTVDFNEPGPPIPGAVTRRGVYENARNQRFQVTAAAPTENEPTLEAFLTELKVSYEADLVVEGPEPPRLDQEPDAADEQLKDLLGHVVDLAEAEREKDAARGAAIALVADLKSAEGIEKGSAIVISAAIDPHILKGECHGHQADPGEHHVSPDVREGRIKLGDLTNRDPVILGVASPSRVFGAGRFCTVTGVADYSRYTLGDHWTKIWEA